MIIGSISINRVMRSRLVWVLIICAAVRIGMLILFPSVFDFEATGAIHGSDAYDRYAQNLLDTGTYGRLSGEPDAAIPPLYSYVLAGLYKIAGRGYLQIGLLHILFDVLSVAILYEIARRLMPHGEPIALLSALFYSLYPYLVFQNLTLIDTPLFMLLLYLFLLLMVILRNTTQKLWIGWAIAGGISLGMAALTRPVALPLAGFVAIWFLFRLNLRQTFVRLLPVAICSILVIAPWVIRNTRLYHTFVTVSVNGGMNFWFGNSEYTVPFLRAGYHTQWSPPPDLAPDLNDQEAEEAMYDIAFDYLDNHPNQIPKLLWEKFIAYWDIDIFPHKNPDSGTTLSVMPDGSVREASGNDEEMIVTGVPKGDPVDEYSQPLFDRIGRWVHIVYYGGLFLLALVGIGFTLKQWREVALLWFTLICMTLVYVIYVPATRYRVPTDPILFIFSAYTVRLLWNWLTPRVPVLQKVQLLHG